jgi:succinyl-CoA synthetase beta subunit
VKLYEFEGHRIFARAGIESPFFIVCSDIFEVEQARKRLKFPIVAKVQVLSGKRGKSGGVKICANEKQLLEYCRQFFDKDFLGEKVRFIQLSEKVDIEEENYISITYDTVLKIPFLLFSKKGGVDIEEVRKNEPDSIIRADIDPFLGPDRKQLEKNSVPFDFAMRMWDVFWKYDARLVEVNPFAKLKNGDFVAIDSKIILDDAGLLRHKDLDVLPKGSISAIASERELLAREIDAEDYRGTAGSKFIEFDGDIAVLASGGGASLMLMDSLYGAGGVPANYTEYSGNPPREKVEKLTKIALSREGLTGCLVAGAVANFTDIFETLSGFADGLKKIRPKPDYPIVIRRGGPRQKEAFEMLEAFAKKEGFDIHMFGPETPISVAAKKMVEFSKKYTNKK